MTKTTSSIAFLFVASLVALGAQPQLKSLKAVWDPYPLANYPNGSNAVITLYKSTSLGTVWTPFKPAAVTPAGRTSQVFVVVVPNKFRFYATATIQPFGESGPSNMLTNDLTVTTALRISSFAPAALSPATASTTTTNENRIYSIPPRAARTARNLRAY